MANTVLFINAVRDTIAAKPDFATEGYNKERVYRQYLPQVKDPQYPCITLSFEKERMEAFADIATGTLFVSVHTKTFSKTQSGSDWLSKVLHMFTFSDGETVVYKCQEQDGPPTPTYDKNTETWESMQSFHVAFA